MKLLGVEMPEILGDALAQCRRHFLAAAGFSFVINLLFLAPPLYMLQVYDRVVPTGGTTTLLFITVGLGLALVAMSILDMVRNRLFLRVGKRLDALIAPKILRQMMAADSAAAGQAMRDFDTVRGALSTPAMAAFFDAPWTPVFLIVAFLLHFWIGILAIVASVALVSVAWLNQRTTGHRMAAASSAMAAAQNSQQAAAIHGSTIKALGMTGAIVDRQLAHREAALDNMISAQFAGSRLAAASRFLRLYVQSIALGLGALLAIAGDISSGAIIASSILLGRALQPVESIVGAWSSLASARAAADRLRTALSAIGEARIYTLLPPPAGRLDVEEVGLRGSDGRPIVVGVSFQLEPGSVLGIIGPSGSGKTTLGKMLVGALQPTVGTVRIDGARLADWNQDELGRWIGYMPQEPSLFEGTVKENIARFAPVFGEDDARAVDEAVVAAAKAAGVHDMILHLPKGYDTPLGLLGNGVSAGQAQRIALARALYGDPTLLILDEPNAFLDQAGEAALLSAIRAASERGASVLLIAHRRGVLEAANRLLVLDEGRVKMVGPAAEVVARLAAPGRSENAA